MEVQESCCWKKKYPQLDALKRVRGTGSLYPCHRSPEVAQLSAKRDLLSLRFVPWGRVTACECPATLAAQTAAKKTNFFLTPSRVFRCAVCPGGGEWLGEQHSGLSDGIKGTQILLTPLQTLSGNLPVSRWGLFTCRSPQLAHRHPNILHASPTYASTLWPAPLAYLQLWQC